VIAASTASGRSRPGGLGGCGAPDVRGVLQIASLAGPCEVIARAQAHDVGELAKQITCGSTPPRRDTHDELPVGHC
jgi:hypothetical protein